MSLKDKLFPPKNHIRSNAHRPNCMIIVESTKKRILRYVPEKFIPRDSFARDYKSLFIHTLGLDLNGEFWPIAPLREIVENESPKDLFMAKHCATEVEEVYGLSMPMSEKIKLGILAGLCFGILIVLFLIVSSAGGTSIQ